jgi:hypothetical protein
VHRRHAPHANQSPVCIAYCVPPPPHTHTHSHAHAPWLQPLGKGIAVREGITRSLTVDDSASSTHGCGWGVGDELRRDVEYSLLEGLYRGVLMPLPIFVPTPEHSVSSMGKVVHLSHLLSRRCAGAV